MNMNRNNKLLISVLSFSLLATLMSVEAKNVVRDEVNLNVTTTHENAIGRVDVGRHNVLIGSDAAVSYSPTYVQCGTDSNGKNLLRFATAVKGDISKLTYTLNYEGLQAPLTKEVTSVYKGIQSGGSIVYYNGSEVTTTPSDYYWACVTVRFTSNDKDSLELTGQLTINDSTVIDGKTATLAAVKEGAPGLSVSDEIVSGKLQGEAITLPTYSAVSASGINLTDKVVVKDLTDENAEISADYTTLTSNVYGTHTIEYSVTDELTGKTVTAQREIEVYRKLFRNSPALSTVNQLTSAAEQNVLVKDGGMATTRFNMANGKVYYAEATYTTSYNVLAGLMHIGEDGFADKAERWLYMTLRPTDNFLNIKDNTRWTGGTDLNQTNIVGTMGISVQSGTFKIATARVNDMFYMFVNDQYVKSYTSDYYADMDTAPGIYINSYGDEANVEANGISVSNIDFYNDTTKVQEKVASLTNGKMLMPYVPGLDYWKYVPGNYSFGYSAERGNYVDMQYNNQSQNNCIWSPHVYFGGNFSFEFDYAFESSSAAENTQDGRMWIELRSNNNGTPQIEFGAKYSMADPQFMMDREQFKNGGGKNPDDSTTGTYYQPVMSSFGVNKTQTFHYKVTRTLNSGYSAFAMVISKTDGTVIASKTWENKGVNATDAMTVLVQSKAVKGKFSNVSWEIL